MKGVATVAGWKEVRFRQMYTGFEVNVLKADGSVAPGNTRLTTVRGTYLDEQ